LLKQQIFPSISEYFEPTPPPTTRPRDPFQPSRQPPLVVGIGHQDNDNIPDSDGNFIIGKIQTGNPHKAGKCIKFLSLRFKTKNNEHLHLSGM
jgi:hypothetical protein